MKKLEKVIINGEVFYKEVEDNESTTTNNDNTNNQTNDGIGTDFGKEKSRKQTDGLNFDEFSKRFSGFGSTISETINKALSKASTELENAFGKHGTRKASTPKEKKILAMLPFMDDEDIHDIFTEVIKNPEEYSDVNPTIFLPFLEDEDITELFKIALKSGDTDFISAISPFVDDEDLDDLVDEYIAGKLPNLDIDTLYPFLSSDAVKKLIRFELKKKNN